MYANAHYIGKKYPICIHKISDRDFLKMLIWIIMSISRVNLTPEWAATLNISSVGKNPNK